MNIVLSAYYIYNNCIAFMLGPGEYSGEVKLDFVLLVPRRYCQCFYSTFRFHKKTSIHFVGSAYISKVIAFLDE